MKLFWARLLERLVSCKAISEELGRKLPTWRYPLLSSGGGGDPYEDKKALEMSPAL